MSSTVLVLGAEGFIGRHVRTALAPHHRLVSVDVRPLTALAAFGSTLPHEERLFRVDLGDPVQIAELFAAIAPLRDSLVGVVHLAAHYDFANRPDARYHRLQAALPTLIEGLRTQVPADAPIVYAASMAGLEGTEPGRPLTADAPRATGWQYPRWKAAAERALEEARLPQPLVELVLAGVYSDLGELVPLYQQIERVRSGSPEAIFYPGSPDRGLTYVHVDDVARAFTRAITRFRGETGVHRFLVGEPRPVTYRAIHDRASRVFHGRRLPILRLPRALAWLGAAVFGVLARIVGRRRFIQPWMIRYAGEHYELDLRATREGLGWEPTHRLEHRLDRILELARAHGALWREVNERRPW